MTAPALIGRDHPASVLRGEVDRTVGSHGGLVLVTGEAGIGKSTLVAQVAADAGRAGALVLSGTCWDGDGAPGYWPWVQVLRGLRRAVSAAEWAESGDRLSILLGEADGGQAAFAKGFELADALTTVLVAASRVRPVLVVLEDLHWADAASLRLLEFVARHAWFERLLLVGTYRDVEVEAAGHPLEPLLLPLLAKATTVTLTGLDPAEVGALVARTTGAIPDQDVVAEIHHRTGGNPFFVEQTARLWHSGSALTAMAPGIRAALQRRLALVSAELTELLTAAAVLGPEFPRPLLAALLDIPVPQLNRQLAQAVSARLVTPLAPGRFGFAHDLVRELVYASLEESEARRRHAAVISALQDAPALAEGLVPAEIARHAHLAVPVLAPESALEYLVAAARDATGRLAAEEAAGHYQRALDLVPADRRRAGAGIALCLAKAQYFAGNPELGRQTLAELVDLARDLDDHELLAHTALTLRGLSLLPEKDPAEVDLITEAHRKLIGGAPPILDTAVRELSIRTAVLARRGNDDAALGLSLAASYDASWEPGTAGERLAILDELVQVARRRADREAELEALSLRIWTLVELGDPAYLDQHTEFVAMAERHGTALSRHEVLVNRSTIAAFTGHFDEARTLIEAAYQAGEQPQIGRELLRSFQRWALDLLQGRYDEVAALLPQIMAFGEPFAFPLLEAIPALYNGNVDTAVRHLREIIDTGRGYPKWRAPMWLRFQAQAAAASRDPVLCEAARTAIAPFAGEWLVTFGTTVDGPVALWMGLLDAAQQRWDSAVSGFTSAYRAADRLQARPWSVLARVHLAEALLARGSAGDRAAAAGLLDEVEREAGELGMLHLVEQSRQLRQAGPPRTDSAEPLSGNVFSFDGNVWTVGFAGRSVHVPDAKGLHDLHLLLERPGTEIPAVTLLNPAGGAEVVAAASLGGDELLDEEAKARYRRRLTDLDEQIDRAVGQGNDTRAAELDRERAALLDELRGASGLAGRARRFGDAAERARKTVTARIRDTLRKLDQRHPELAEHLREAVTTGATCRYRPDRPTAWTLRG